jgi:hypothetical protein
VSCAPSPSGAPAEDSTGFSRMAGQLASAAKVPSRRVASVVVYEERIHDIAPPFAPLPPELAAAYRRARGGSVQAA